MLQGGSPFLFCAGRSSLRSGNNSMAVDVPPALAQDPAFCPSVFGTRGGTLKACPEGEGIGRRWFGSIHPAAERDCLKKAHNAAQALIIDRPTAKNRPSLAISMGP